MISGRPAYEVIDHTADTGVIVHAGSLPLLFETAAAAMFDLMADLSRLPPQDPPIESTAAAGDLEALLVTWLDELLGRAMASGRVYSEFEVTSLKRGSEAQWTVAARVRGATLDPDDGVFRTEVKAVTWHHLAIERDGDGWLARVIFDI